MNFDRTTVAPCIIPEAVPADPRCENSEFALANPGICPLGSLILKPSVMRLCVGGSIRFQVYEYKNGFETLLDDEIRFTSSDLEIFSIGVRSGSGTALSAGFVRITATHEDGRTIAANLTIRTAEDCCADVIVASAIVIDNSRSMTLAFGGDYATRLDYAKQLASLFSGQLGPVVPPDDDDDSEVPPDGDGGAIYYYSGDNPNDDGLVPDEPLLPALAYKITGDGPIYGWNVTLQVWA